MSRTPPVIPAISLSPQRKQGLSLLPPRARRMILFVVASCALPAVVSASSSAFDAPRVRAEAESAFARGKATEDPVKARAEFARAAMLYAQLRGSNPDLHLNEGNAQVLAGQLPDAILAYQRGMRLAPSDSRLRDNLTYVRQRIAYPGEHGRPPASTWPSWLPQPSTELLVILAVV